jgi:hypothetical protein
MKYLSVVLVLFLTVSFVFGQKSAYTIRRQKRQLVVKHQGKAHTLKLGDKIDAAKITDTKILFANRRGALTYLLIDVSGQSKEESDDRQCGAGIESNLIWIKLDAAWKIVEAQSERYESCWSATNSDDGYKINGNLLTIELNNYRRNIDAKLSYDADAPEKGFRIEQKAQENK